MLWIAFQAKNASFTQEDLKNTLNIINSKYSLEKSAASISLAYAKTLTMTCLQFMFGKQYKKTRAFMPVMRFLVQSGNELHITKRTFKDVLNFLEIQRQKLHKLSYFDFFKMLL